ncbi:hypothetical protein BH10ACI1_BH10ACI1_27770 [soil metagenome]
MINKSILKMLLMMFALMIAGSFSVHAQKTDCPNKTDNDIVMSIYEKMKVKYADQIIHVNVRVKDGVVTLEGWTTTKKIKKEIEKIAKKTECVKSVDNQLTVGKGIGCGPGYKECGGACIPEKETCNICLIQRCN